MQWGNDILDWLASSDGQRILLGAIIPAVAIIVAGIVAALIGRGSTKRVIAQYQRDALTAAVQGLVLAGRKAATWNSIGTVERVQVDHLIGEAETRIRLLAVPGAALAANWSAHQLEDMKRNSAGFSFQAQQTLAEYRDRLIAWSEKPRHAKKLFGADLERWKYEADPADQQLIAEQAEWEARTSSTEHEKSVGTPAAAAGASTTATTVAPVAAESSPAPAAAQAPAATPAAAIKQTPSANHASDSATDASADRPREASPATGPSITPPPAVIPPAVSPWAAPVQPAGAPQSPAPLSESSSSAVSPGAGDDAPPPLSANQVRDRISPDED